MKPKKNPVALYLLNMRYEITNVCLIFFFITTTVLFFDSPFARAQTAKDKFYSAEKSYNRLVKNRNKIKYRHNWERCIEKYRAVYKHDPSGPWAAAGMYKTGLLYAELFKYSNNTSDIKKAADIFKKVIKRYPKSRYKEKADKALRRISTSLPKKTAPIKTAQKNKKNIPLKKRNRSKEKYLAKKKKTIPKTISASGPRATVNYLRYSNYPNQDLTRVVVETDRETLYTHGFLRKDPKLKKPMRMYIDIKSSRLSDRLKKKLPEKENRLKVGINKNLDVRISQNKPDVVRVVMYNHKYNGNEFKTKNYELKEYFNPFRIVIDVKGKPTKVSKPGTPIPKQIASVSKKRLTYTPPTDISATDLAKQLSLGVSHIVIDAGHGGRDYGAPGYLKGIHEKDVVLAIAKKLAAKIKKKLRCKVTLTRSRDKFLTLEERTAIANRLNADLFISLHANASRNKKAYGIETYFLNLATDKEAMSVAAKENATSTKNMSDLQSILTDLMKNAKINESSRLAVHIQNSMYSHMKKKYSRIKNKGVKQAPFYVLLGAQMPSVLIETAFISNPKECKRLVNTNFQNNLCDAITVGIGKYIKEINGAQLENKHIKSSEYMPVTHMRSLL